MAALRPLPAPPWKAVHAPEPVALDEGGQVDVTPYVRFETGHNDINYGVLDIQVYFMHEQPISFTIFRSPRTIPKTSGLLKDGLKILPSRQLS